MLKLARLDYAGNTMKVVRKPFGPGGWPPAHRMKTSPAAPRQAPSYQETIEQRKWLLGSQAGGSWSWAQEN